jgi:threonine/homoserine/homoserine lactone efflux protein
MTFHIWLVFMMTEFLLSLSPGPAVLLVLSHGLRRGARASRQAALGILFTNACYFTLSALGLGALLLASGRVFTAVKWLGILYLVYLGVKMLIHADGPPGAAAETTPPKTQSSFWQGVALQAGNPKAILFFVALLPQFITPQQPVLPQFALLGTSSIVMELGILFAYGYLAERASAFFTTPRAHLLQERLSGSFLIAAAVGVGAVQEAAR